MPWDLGQFELSCPVVYNLQFSQQEARDKVVSGQLANCQGVLGVGCVGRLEEESSLRALSLVLSSFFCGSLCALQIIVVVLLLNLGGVV